MCTVAKCNNVCLKDGKEHLTNYIFPTIWNETLPLNENVYTVVSMSILLHCFHSDVQCVNYWHQIGRGLLNIIASHSLVMHGHLICCQLKLMCTLNIYSKMIRRSLLAPLCQNADTLKWSSAEAAVSGEMRRCQLIWGNDMLQYELLSLHRHSNITSHIRNKRHHAEELVKASVHDINHICSFK